MSDTQSVYWTEIDSGMADGHPVEILMKECGCTKERAIDLLIVSYTLEIPESYVY